METPPAEVPADEGTISPEKLQQELQLLRSRLAEADKRVAAAAAVQVRITVRPYLGALLLLGGHEICSLKSLLCSVLLQAAKVTTLEKTNQQLSWQVAMLTRGGEGKPVHKRRTVPDVEQGAAAVDDVVTRQSLFPSVMGALLAQRKYFIIGYLIVLHLLVYIALTSNAFCSIKTAAA